MPLRVTLDSHGEQLLSAYLSSGRYRSPEEVVTRALETLAEKEPPHTGICAGGVTHASMLRDLIFSHPNRMTGVYRASALFDPFPKCTKLLLKPRRFALPHIFPIQH